MAAVVKPLFIGKIAKSNKEKENEAVKKWVVEIEKESGRVETRLVPARNKCTAISKIYVCYDNTATKDNVGDTDPNYKALSFAFPTTSGWQLLEGFDPEHPLEMWCEKLGGSSVGKGNGAYLWSNNNAAWCVLYVFGIASNGAYAGLPCVGAGDGSGGARWDIGGVLLKKRQ